MYGGNARSGPNYLVQNGAVAVPSDFVGLHFRAWPLFNSAFWASWPQPYPTQASQAPTISFGHFRIHDTGYNYWHQVETSQGVYDFSGLDTIISAHKAAGRTVYFCMEGCPSFYLSASNPALGHRDQNWVYPDSTSPNGLTALSNFITALITRYNTSGGAWGAQTNGSGTNFSVWGKGIQAIEYMNEPLYQTGSYWCSTAAQLVDFAYTIRTAAKAIDSSIVCVSPGFVAPNTMQTFLLATGAINTGVTGLSLCDAICIHHYNETPPCLGLGSYSELLSTVAYFKQVVAFCGGSALPIWCTEAGFDGNYPTTELSLIAAQSPQWRYNWWGRFLLTAAALGFQKWTSYAWDVPYLWYPDSDPTGTAQVLNDVHANVAGKTIKNAFYDVGGAVTLQFADGSSFAI